MPDFTFQAPDGSKITVRGPEGSTAEEALVHAKREFAAQGKGDFPNPVAEAGKGFLYGTGQFLKGLPKAMVAGLADTAAASGQAEAGVMGMPVEQGKEGEDDYQEGVPGSEHSAEILEKNVTGDLPAGKGFGGALADRFGRALTNPTTYLGTGSIPLKVGGALAASAGSELGKRAMEGTEWTGTGEFLGGLAGGTVAGLPGAAKAGVKSAQAIKDLAGRAGIKQAANDAYDEIRTSPNYMTRPQSMAFMQEIYDDVFGKRGNWDKRTAATTYGMLTDFYNDFASKPKNYMADILAFYKKLNAVHPSARGGYEDAAAASQMRRSILDILQRDVAQDRDAFGRAMGNWTAQKKIEELEKSGMVAEHKRQASGTGQNLNTIRQQMRQILDNEKRARGYTDAEKAQMEHIINGGTWDNALRWVDKGFSPANPLGAKSSLISMLLSLPITVAVGGAGLLTHRIGDYLNDREMERLINMVQMRAPVNVRSGASARAQTLMDAYDVARRRARHSAYRGGANALANPGTDIPEADDEGDAQ